jgi:hypothetical protein
MKGFTLNAEGIHLRVYGPITLIGSLSVWNHAVCINMEVRDDSGRSSSGNEIFLEHTGYNNVFQREFFFRDREFRGHDSTLRSFCLFGL